MNKRERLIAQLGMRASQGLIDREPFIAQYKGIMTNPVSLMERIFGVPKITVPEAMRDLVGDDPLEWVGNSMYDTALKLGEKTDSDKLGSEE